MEKIISLIEDLQLEDNVLKFFGLPKDTIDFITNELGLDCYEILEYPTQKNTKNYLIKDKEDFTKSIEGKKVFLYSMFLVPKQYTTNELLESELGRGITQDVYDTRNYTMSRFIILKIPVEAEEAFSEEEVKNVLKNDIDTIFSEKEKYKIRSKKQIVVRMDIE